MNPSDGLDDITVIELGAAVTAPYAGQVLHALGADVIKIEPPGGDPFRRAGVETDGGMSGYFAMCNCGKRSVRLNLKTADGKTVFRELASEADIVIENYRPGVLERLDIGYESLKRENDEIVYCSFSGYGEDSPWSQRPGFDPILQAQAGLMSVTGEKDGKPVRMGVAIVDLMTAVWGVIMVMNALRQRDRTGESVYIDTAMFDVAISLLTKHASKFFITGQNPERMGTEDNWTAPYGAYPTRDDDLIMIGAPWQKMWEKLCNTIGLEHLLEDDRFRTNADRVENREQLNQELEAKFRQKTREEWLEQLRGEVPVAPVNDVREALDNEQVEARQLRSVMEHPEYGAVDVLRLPIRSDGDVHEFGSPPPTLGEHTDEILREHGYEGSRIEQFRERDVI